MTLLELNSLSVLMFDLGHDGIGVKRLGFLLHTVFWKQICRHKTASHIINQFTLGIKTSLSQISSQ